MMMSALISDVIEGTVTPSVANAAVNAGGKLLKVTELQLKYGKTTKTGNKELLLFGDDRTETDKEIRYLEDLKKKILAREDEIKKASP